MKNIYKMLVIPFCLISCIEVKDGVERISSQNYEVITDSIFTRMPGSIFYQDNKVYWEDAIAFDNFIHVVSVSEKKEILSFANKGQGPHDFSTPVISLSHSGGLYINDGDKPLEILYQTNDNSHVSTQIQKYENLSMTTRLLHLDDGMRLYLCPEMKELFQIKGKHLSDVSFGERPIKDEINNAYDVFQGNVLYNPRKKMLVYSNLIFPYISIYETSDKQEWGKKQEWKGDWDYTINEGKLNFSSETEKGAMELALTDDYIVLLQRDNEVEEAISRNQAGRDISTLPHSLFVYDYELRLQKIINMPFPMLRLCGDLESNEVYAMSINPEFELIRIDLDN